MGPRDLIRGDPCAASAPVQLMLTVEADYRMPGSSSSNQPPRSDASIPASPKEGELWHSRPLGEPPVESFPLVSSTAMDVPMAAEPVVREMRRSPAIRILPPKGMESGVASQTDADEDGVAAVRPRRKRRSPKVIVAEEAVADGRRRRLVRSSPPPLGKGRRRGGGKVGRPRGRRRRTEEAAGEGGEGEGTPSEPVISPTLDREPILRRSPRKNDPDAIAIAQPADSLATLPSTNTIRIRLRASKGPSEDDVAAATPPLLNPVVPPLLNEGGDAEIPLAQETAASPVKRGRRKRRQHQEAAKDGDAAGEQPVKKRFRRRRATTAELEDSTVAAPPSADSDYVPTKYIHCPPLPGKSYVLIPFI